MTSSSSDTRTPIVFFEHHHDAERDDERPDDGGDVGEQLLAEQARARRRRRGPRLNVETEEARVGEEADQQRADEPADEVHADDVEGVVVAGLELHLDGVAADQRRRSAPMHDRRRAGRRSRRPGVIATRPATMPDAAPRFVGVTVADPLDDDPRQPGRGGGEERVHERLGGLAVGGERRAGVEAEPAEPQDAGADHHERHRVRRLALAAASPCACRARARRRARRCRR